jgi:hypothetical protein
MFMFHSFETLDQDLFQTHFMSIRDFFPNALSYILFLP